MPSFPSGVETCQIIFGKGISPTGNPQPAQLDVEVVLGGVANSITWEADGTPLLRLVDTFKAEAGTVGVAEVPVVDQSGWLNGALASFTNWAYKLTERVGRVTRVKYVQPQSGQETIDFDLIPDGVVGLPGSAPVVPVTSVNGQTGAVTLPEGITETEIAASIPDAETPIGTALSTTFARFPTGRDMLPDGSRRSTLVLGTPNGAGVVNANYTQRCIAKIPVTAKRWRMRVGNRSASTSYTSPGSITGLWIGDPDYATSDPFRWNGNYAAAPTKVWDGGTVPTDGSDLVSPWIEGGLDAGEEVLLSMGVITTNTGTGTAYGQSRQIWRVTSAGGSTQAGNQNLTGSAIADNGLFYDIRIEYEFEGSEPIGLFVGDSITDGYSDGDLTASQQGTHSHEAWPGVAGMQGRFNFINLGSAGATAGSFGNPSSPAWNRVDLATTVPDFAVVALGINDVHATTAITSWQAQMRNIVNHLKSLGIKRIILATLAPREYEAAQTATLTANAAVGATTLTVDRVITGTILVGQGPTQEQLVVSSAAGNTLTLSSATSKAHAAGDSIANTKERLRRQYNDFIRNIPWGVSGVLDYDAILAASPGSASPDPRMMSADLLHPLRAGYALIGSAAKGLVG